MARDDETKLLRACIVHDHRVVEERLLRKHENVSVGAGTKNTFIVPGVGLPKSTILLEARGTSEYALVFERGMDGRVDLGETPMTLAELARTRHVERRGSKYIAPLPSNARGKVLLGNVTLLFQFVDAPAVLPKPQLPAAAKGGIASQLEWPLVYILIGSFLLLGGFGTGLDVWWNKTGKYMQSQYGERTDRLYELLNVEVRQERKEEEDKPDKVEAAKVEAETKVEVAEEVVEAQPEPPKPKPRPTPEVKQTPQTASERLAQREKLTTKVRESTFLHALGSKGGGDDSPMDTLARGVHAERLANAFGDDTSKGVTAATGETGGFVGGPSEDRDGGRYKTLSADDTGGKRITTAAVKTDKKDAGSEIKVRANVRDGAVSGQTGTGQIDSGAVARVFARRKGAIRHCYESRLKTIPDLRGKVTIRFTIGPAGRVTDISVTENTTNDSAVAQCIVGKVREWKFDPPQGGSVTFSYPFLLDTR